MSIQTLWGFYDTLKDIPGSKVRDVTIMPGQSTIFCRHCHRSSRLLVINGTCVISKKVKNKPDGIDVDHFIFLHKSIKISRFDWYKISNVHEEPCNFIEIQYGDFCDDNDIEEL